MENKATTYQSRAELFVREFIKDDPEQIKARLSRVTVVIGITKSLAKTRLGQIGLVTSTNIIARLGTLVPNLYFDIPTGVKVLPGIPLLTPGQDLADALLGLTQALAKLQQGAKIRSRANKKSHYDCGMFIGKATVRARQSVVVGANRWLSVVRADGGSERLGQSDRNPLGIILAACMGSAEVLKHVWLMIRSAPVKIETINERVVVSTYDFSVNHRYPDNPVMRSPCELLHACLFGCGAIGSGVLFVLGCLPDLKMSLDLVDMDFIEPSNEERLFTSSNPQADVGQLKVVHAQEFVQQTLSNVCTFTYPMRYEKFVAESRNKRLGYVWVGLDSAKARRDLQSELISVVCNGATDAGRWMVSRQEYENLDNACLIDLYKQAHTQIFDPILELSRRYGLSVSEVRRWSHTGGVLDHEVFVKATDRQPDASKRREICALRSLSYQQVAAKLCSTMRPSLHSPAATISFVSLMPAVAMVSDLVKRRLYRWKPQREEPNLLIFDTLNHPRRSKRLRVLADRDCLCQSKLYQEAFATRQKMRYPYLNRMFRSSSLASLPDNLRNEMKRRKKLYAHHFK